jgi:hypothetical protein
VLRAAGLPGGPGQSIEWHPAIDMAALHCIIAPDRRNLADYRSSGVWEVKTSSAYNSIQVLRAAGLPGGPGQSTGWQPAIDMDALHGIIASDRRNLDDYRSSGVWRSKDFQRI